MKIYTRTGDKGTTSLVYGSRVPKSDLRVEAYGTCDEANAMIGFAVSCLAQEEWEEKEKFLQQMHLVQTLLFHVGSELSTPSDQEVHWKVKKDHIEELEQQIDDLEQEVPSLKNFIIPSGHQAASAFHVARTVVRRTERITVRLQDELDNKHVLAYINRLSDYLFVAARYINHVFHEEEQNLHADE